MKKDLGRVDGGLARDFRNTINSALGDIENNFKEAEQRIDNVVVNASSGEIQANDARLNAKGEVKSSLKKRLDDDYTEVTAQLAEKIKKGDVSVSDINKNKGKLDQTYMTDEFLQQMAGNTPINAVPADNSITPKKTTFMSVSTNLIDPTKRKDGYSLLYGYNVDNPDSYVSSATATTYQETFPAVSGDVFYSNASGRLVWYSSTNLSIGNAILTYDSSLGLYKGTVGGGVKVKLTGLMSDMNADGYWFVCKSTNYSGSKSPYGSTVLMDTIQSNIFAKKTEINPRLTIVESDVSFLKNPINSVNFFVPKYLYCFENQKSEKWISKWNVMTARNYSNFYLDITAGWGYFRDWERVRTQATDVVKVKNVSNGTEVYSKTYVRRSVDPYTKSNPTNKKNILWIGDSFSDAGYLPCDAKKYLVNTFGFSNFNFIGTKTDTIEGVTALNEGRGGYTLDDFIKVNNTEGRGSVYPNPFLNNGTVSFLNYMSRNNFEGNIDYAVIELGVNNIVALNNDTETIRNRMKSLIDLIFADYPNCKIFIVGLVPLSKINASSDVYTHNSLVLNVNKAYEELCESTPYLNKCIYVDTGVFFDTEHGYPYENKPYRGSIEPRKVQTDWLHPYAPGYYMMSDSIVSAFVYHM